MIRNFQFLWLTWLFPVASLSFMPVSEPVIPPAYTAGNKLFEFADTATYFIVLKNDRNCHNCLVSMNEFVSKIKNPGCRFAVIICCDSTALDRKRAFADTKKLMPDFDTLLFQYKESESSLFRSMHTNYTPEIVILKNSIVTFIPYKDIFDNSTLEILPETQTLIATLLDEKQ
jgi:hypothetical protein